jgi:hypothetical protein
MGIMHGRSRPRDSTLALNGISFLVIGILLSYSSYSWGITSLNPSALMGAILFWYAILFLLLAFPLREAASIFYRQVRTFFGAGVFSIYLTIHLLLYGFLLEAILASVFGQPAFSLSPRIYVNVNVFMPPSLLNMLLGLAYNPSITAVLTPAIGATLSLYGIAVALLIGLLLVANIGRTRELGELCTRGEKAGSFIILPTIGIVLGASCCLSVPFLITLAEPSAALLASAIWIYYATYFFFPAFTGTILYINLYAVGRASTRLQSPAINGGARSPDNAINVAHIPPPPNEEYFLMTFFGSS